VIFCDILGTLMEKLGHKERSEFHRVSVKSDIFGTLNSSHFITQLLKQMFDKKTDCENFLSLFLSISLTF